VAKKEGDWWRIPAALLLAVAVVPVYIAGEVEAHVRNTGGSQ